MENPASVLEFWFGTSKDDAAVASERAKLWWIKRDETDGVIRERFEHMVRKAAERELDAWSESAQGRLALLILTDQFPRNMYRNTPEAFAFDAMAREWCKEGLRNNAHHALRPIERVFFYLPLEHSESMDDQEQAVALFRELMDSVGEAGREVFAGFLDYAVRHREVIARFGRFPHRNRILGRESSAEEIAFLKEPGSSF
ncbi:DUF924 family protein [Noviherbaspirillum sp. ST9]|uniref:DUF924 family protein n=1 Tax=Noviherbaspirillum sp. ST9 TaxID=3401606 RepID=UPI003B585B52